MDIVFKNFNEKKDKEFIVKSLLSAGLSIDEIFFTDRTFYMAYNDDGIRVGFLCLHDTKSQICLKHFFITKRYEHRIQNTISNFHK